MGLLADIEDFIVDFGWEVSRPDENELITIVPGQWCHYKLHYIWQESINALYIIYSVDISFDVHNNLGLLNFIIAANQRLWVGHFDLREDGGINYRHVLHLYNLDDGYSQVIKEVTFIMFSEFELFYPGFSKLEHDKVMTVRDIELLSLETRGNA